DDVEHALVRAGLVLVTRVLVDVRGDEDGVALDLGRQRDRAAHLRAGPLGRFDDLAGRAVDQTVIVRLEPNPDLLVRHDGIPWLKSDGYGGVMRRTPVVRDPSRGHMCTAKTKAGRLLPARPRRKRVNACAGLVRGVPGGRHHATCPCLANTRCVLPLISLVAANDDAFAAVVAHSSGFPQECATGSGSRLSRG